MPHVLQEDPRLAACGHVGVVRSNPKAQNSSSEPRVAIWQMAFAVVGEDHFLRDRDCDGKRIDQEHLSLNSSSPIRPAWAYFRISMFRARTCRA